MLAEIIAHTDTNQNLDLLSEDCTWKQRFWLQFFSTEDAIKLKVRLTKSTSFLEMLYYGLDFKGTDSLVPHLLSIMNLNQSSLKIRQAFNSGSNNCTAFDSLIKNYLFYYSNFKTYELFSIIKTEKAPSWDVGSKSKCDRTQAIITKSHSTLVAVNIHLV